MYRKPRLLILIAALLTFVLPFAWRMMLGNPALPGEYSYFHLDSFLLRDVGFSFIWAALIAGSTALLLLYVRLVRLYTANPLVQFIAPLFFILTPATIYLSLSVSPYLVVLLLLFAAVNLLHSRYSSFAFVVLVPALFFDWLSFFAVLLLFSMALWYKSEFKLLSFFAPAFIFAFVAVQILFSRPLFFEIFPSYAPLVSLFSDLESLHGIGVFVFLLALIGFVWSWVEKRKLFLFYSGVVVLFMLFLFGNIHALLFLYPLLVFPAAVTFVYFLQRQWEFHILRFLTLAVLVYGVLFSSLSYMNRVVVLPPTPAVFDSLKELPSGIVVSHPQKSFWIAYGSDAEPFITYLDPDYDGKLNVTLAFLMSRDLRKTQGLIEATNATHVWIDEQMKHGQVWNNKDDGLLFLLREGHFAKVYDEDGIEVWKVG